MPRLTPQQLQEAKRKKAEEAEEAERRREEWEGWILNAHDQYAQLTSVATGLYEEQDKLARKWPNMPASKLTIDKANKLIRAVKELMKGEDDAFVTDITEFVPAGDDIEMRDMVLTLSEVRQALTRFRAKYREEWQDRGVWQ